MKCENLQQVFLRNLTSIITEKWLYNDRSKKHPGSANRIV